MEEEIILIEENDIEEIEIEEENYSGKSYVLPIASKDILGGIKVGKNLTINEDGTLDATGGGMNNDTETDTFFLTGSHQSLPSSVFATVLYDNLEGSCFSVSDGIITCRKSGKYLILLNNIFEKNSSGTRYQDIRYNGRSYALGSSGGANDIRACLSSFAIIDILKNETLLVRAYQTSGSNVNLISGTSGSSINFIKI